MWAMVMLGLGYLTPSVVFDTFGIALRNTKGHVPTAYVITLIAMMFTAISYGRMAKVYSTAGSSYSYALKTLGPSVGFMVGWLSLLDYLLLPLINVLLAQQYLSAIFPTSEPWIWILAVTAVVTGINIRGIESTSTMNSLFVYFQIAVVFAFIALSIKELLNGAGMGTLVSLEPFYNNEFDISAIINGATILCFSFLGFDAVSNYTEEAINPKRDVPRAILLTALVGGGIFIITSYITQLVYPDVSLFNDIENSTAPDISYYVGGRLFQIIFLAASFFGVFASGLASHASVSRLLYVMGRDDVLPKKVFSYLSPRFYTPVANIVFVGLVCLFAFLFSVQTAIYFISFGSLIAFSFVNITVIFHYAIKRKQVKTVRDALLNLITPTLGLLFIFVLWLNINSTTLIIGVSWGLIGLLYFFYLKRHKFANVNDSGSKIII
jgi:putrescine importer